MDGQPGPGTARLAGLGPRCFPNSLERLLQVSESVVLRHGASMPCLLVLRAINTAETDALRVGVVQNFYRVAIKDISNHH